MFRWIFISSIIFLGNNIKSGLFSLRKVSRNSVLKFTSRMSCPSENVPEQRWSRQAGHHRQPVIVNPIQSNQTDCDAIWKFNEINIGFGIIAFRFKFESSYTISFSTFFSSWKPSSSPNFFSSNLHSTSTTLLLFSPYRLLFLICRGAPGVGFLPEWIWSCGHC